MCGLKVRFTQSPEARGVFAYAIKVEVVEANGISPKIFVYHQSPAGVEGNSFATFDHVATPVDLYEIPEDAATETVPWYRTDKCTVWLRSASDLQQVKQSFVDDIGALQRTFGILSDTNNHINQSDVVFDSDGISPEPSDDPHEDDEIEKLKKAIASKVSKDALDGYDLNIDTIEGIREACLKMGEVLGANPPNKE